MEKKPGCSFQRVCFCFVEALCFNTNIDSKECGGPQIIGLRIVAVANISSGSHKIAIINQCPKCKKILGVVTGDTEPIPYRADSVVLSDGTKKKIPYSVCQKCSDPDAVHDINPEPVSQLQSQAQATA